MSEFKISGTGRYVSEWNGNSLNPGTPTSPYAHPNDIGVQDNLEHIIGAGVYFGSITSRNRFFGDGKVVFDLNNGSIVGISGITSTEASPVYRNIKIVRGNSTQLYSGSVSAIGHVIDCFIETDFYSTVGRSSNPFIRCIFKSYLNSKIGWTNIATASGPFLYNSILLSNFDMLWTWASGQCVLLESYVPSDVELVIQNTLNLTSGVNFRNNLFNGKLTVVGGSTYELKQLFNGSPRPDANPAILDLATIYPNVYVHGNFASSNLGIVDLENKICQPDSDFLKRSSSYGFIGGFKPGFEVKKGDSGSNIEITTSQINTSNPDSWVINTPTFNEGFIDFIVKIADTIVQCPRIHFDSLLAFRGNQAGGSVQNNNVPDFFPASYSPLSQAGLRPNRLTYKLRTSQSILKPTIDAEWDNDAVSLGTTPGVFYDQEASAQPTINVVGGVRYGNADPAGLGGTINTINARWVHVRVRLTNQRTI